MNDVLRRSLLYHFCRLQLPGIALTPEAFEKHLDRTWRLFQSKEPSATFGSYLDTLYALDWFVCVGCLEGDRRAWETLFAARTGRSDCLLVDALRARAARLYPRDDERQDSAVTEFWSQLLAAETPDSTPILERYDGQRPLIPWLIRVFQNAHVSRLRSAAGVQSLPDDDRAEALPERPDARWHDAFCSAARESLDRLSESDLLLLGLRVRYRLSQREVAQLLGVHEGTISRQTDKLRDRVLDQIQNRLAAEGWTGQDLTDLVLTEMGAVLLDDPRLGADRLAGMLAARGRPTPIPK